MIRNMVFHISVVLLIAGCGKDEEGIENRSPNGILIEVEAPQTNGWSTEEVTGTRSGMAKTVRQKRRIRRGHGSKHTALSGRDCNEEASPLATWTTT